MRTSVLTAAGGLALGALLLCAATERARAQDADPPARVARLADAEGVVSLEPAGTQAWTAATLNRPLSTGDRLWSAQNSRAELDIGAAVIRLGSNTGFAFLNLDDRSVQMQLSAGTLIVRVRDMQAGQSYEVDAPNVALALQQPGEYRAEVNERGDLTVIKVSEGSALAAGGDGQQVVISAQERVTAAGTDKVAYDSAGLGAPDDFDNWSAARERQVEDADSEGYVASDVPGTQDLDDNGQWQETPEYGYVWIPTAVAAGWVPYRFGHWMWVAPWGWTWVDDARWGFAPFHYGRWTQCAGRWCWVPGPRQARPVYAPALVAWAGGASLGTSVYGSNVGWFPLAPHEVYVPAYRVSDNYVRAINTANTSRLTNSYITDVYQNRITPTHYANNRAAAVTVVPQSIFTSAQSAGTHATALSTTMLAGAVVTAAAPAIAPIRQSVLGAAEGHGVVKPPAALVNKPVVARTVPPLAASFDAQLVALQAGDGRPLGRAELAQLPPAAGAPRVRLAAPRGAVVLASTLPHRAGDASAESAQPSPTTPREPTLTERERALQVSRLPPAQPRPPTASVVRSDRPAWTEPPAALSADDPTHVQALPSSIPVYHPPAAPQAYTAPQEPPRNEQSQRANLHPAVPPSPRPAIHPPAQSHAKESRAKESRTKEPRAKESQAKDARAERVLPQRVTR